MDNKHQSLDQPLISEPGLSYSYTKSPKAYRISSDKHCNTYFAQPFIGATLVGGWHLFHPKIKCFRCTSISKKKKKSTCELILPC